MYPAFPLPNPSPMRKKKAPGFVALTALAALAALPALTTGRRLRSPTG